MAAESVLVLKPSSLGDIVHTLPAVARLKAARPDWQIAWLVNREWAPLLEGNPDVAEIIAFPRGDFRGPLSGARLAGWVWRHCAGRRPAWAIDFQGLLRTALLARASGARRVIGASDAREGAGWFYHRASPAPGGGAAVHAVERSLALAADVVGPSAEPLRFPLPAGGAPAAAEGWEDFVLLHPFSRGVGKSLGRKQVAEVCRELAPRRVVLVGRAEGPAFPRRDHVLDLLNATSLAELIGLIRRARFVLSVDSGPMHLAAALDRPLAGIHTWTDPRKVGPYRADAWVWKGGRLFQMREISTIPEALLTSRAGAVGPEDLRAICRLAREGLP